MSGRENRVGDEMVLWTLFYKQRKIIKDNEMGKKGREQGSV